MQNLTSRATLCVLALALALTILSNVKAHAVSGGYSASGTPANSDDYVKNREIIDEAHGIAEGSQEMLQRLQTLSFVDFTTAFIRKYTMSLIQAPTLEQYFLEDDMHLGTDKPAEATIEPEGSVATLLDFGIPVVNYYISSRFGWRHGRPHKGTDFAAPTGTPIRAAEGGKVIYSGWYYGYGYLIKLDHGNGIKTKYAHCSRILVNQGQYVKKGQLIGKVGNTGNSTGPHLHFEVVAKNVNLDPEQYLPRLAANGTRGRMASVH